MKKTFGKEIYFTPRQAAGYFNLSLSTVKNYIYAGKLRTLKTPGGHHRITKSELLATLGYREVSKKEDSYDFSLKMAVSNAILGVFKTLGPGGERMLFHAKKVSDLSIRIAKVMDMDKWDLMRIEMAGLLHDIGHIGLDRNLFFKKGPLTHREYESIKSHPDIGGKFLGSVEPLGEIVDIVVQHHERIDGRGYPVGLRGKDIRQTARIISIAESYDSMVSQYSYKAPVPKDIAIAELMQYRGTQFDGDIVEIFIKEI